MFELFGMEFYQLLSFGRQLGLSVMGGASLWAMVFLYIAHAKKVEDSSGIFLTWIGLRMRWLVIGGGLLSVAMWTALTMLMPVAAHEGVTLITVREGVLNAMNLMTPLYLAIAVISIFALVKYKNPYVLFNNKKGYSWFYMVAFILSSITVSYYTDLRGLPANEVIFHIFHGFHSVFTLGTVLCLDFMFLSTQKSPFAQKHIFPLFPQISKVIWVGLSLDLLSTLLIYPEAIALTPRFYFAQIVVGILIINGILLSGILTRRILKNIEEGHKEGSLKWEWFATVAGAISITSWSAITFVDQFHDMNISLEIMFAVYAAIIGVLIIGREIWSKLDRRAEEMHMNM